MKNKRIAYLAPELPSLSATFVTNEIWTLEAMGEEIHPYSIHRPHHKAHGEKAAELAARTPIVYEKSMGRNLLDLGWTAVHHKRSMVTASLQLIGDIFKTGIIRIESMKLIYQFIHAAWLSRDLRRKNVEHLHIHFAHVPTQIGMYAAALAGIPFSFMAHANDIFERPLLIKEKIKRSHRTISISSFNIDIMANYGGDRQKIDIVRCGVDSTADTIKENDKNVHGPFVIGTLGRLVEKKGIDTLIRSAETLKRKKIDFQVQIAGDGPLHDQLIKQVEAAHLTQEVIFLGALPHSQVLEWMKTLDAFVLAGKKDSNGDMDGIPVVLMEAMNFGIPVVSTRLSGIPELVIHDETGLLCDPENDKQLAIALIDISKSKELVQRLTEAAKQHIINEFDQKLNASRLLNMFNSSVK
jgi:colanic acid/amylovoran biosynthesis glycosyltransferase